MANNVANGANGAASAGVTGNFNTFLKILTTQLQNQDPTSPMDTNQFTQELVEFSGVEQQLNTNSLLQQLVTASGAGGVKSLLGYVGQFVEAPANNQLLIQGGQADLSYTLASGGADGGASPCMIRPAQHRGNAERPDRERRQQYFLERSGQQRQTSCRMVSTRIAWSTATDSGGNA